MTTRSPAVLVVRKDAPFKTLKEMIAHSAKAPNGIRIGNPGPGSAGEISTQLINSASGATLSPVNYKGAAPAITDLLGGHIEGVILALGALSTHIRSGSLRALAISSPFPELPDVPTLRQLGYKTDILGVWFGFFMPAGVPKTVVDRIVPALEEVARNPGITAQLLPAGIVQEWGSGRALSEEISREFRSVSELLGPRATNAK